MRKIYLIITLLLCFLILNLNNVSAVTAPNKQTAPEVRYPLLGEYNVEYYSSVEGLKRDELLDSLALLSQTNHRYFTKYDEIWGGNCYSDAYEADSSKLIDFYTQTPITNEYCTKGMNGYNPDVHFNREHVWCQSHSGGLYGTSGAGSDIHHIRPTVANINSSRNNSLYGEVDHEKVRYYNTTDGVHAESSNGVLYGYLDGEITEDGVFEPIDSVKGDVARILMYMYMHYSKEVDANKTYSYAGNLSITNIVYALDSDDAWTLLRTWSKLDPVDEFESNRNDYCATVTGVRNPFIDHPEFANMIWNTNYDGKGALIDDGSGADDIVILNEQYKLISKYYNNGVYTKKSNIYLNGDSSSEIANYFHGEVAKDRTTYYNGEYLLMANFDGTLANLDVNNKPIDGINSGYRTDNNDVKHFVYNNEVVDTYTVKDTTLHTMYVTLDKMNSNDYFDNTWEKGIHTVTSMNDLYLSDFLAFAAPCLTDLVLKSNYITSSGIKLQIVEGKSGHGKYLAFRIYVSSINSGLVSGDNLLSEARVYKGNNVFDENVKVKTTFATFNLGMNGDSHSDGSTATSYTEEFDGYVLNIVDGNTFYKSAKDASGNSCIKIGKNGVTGSFSFTVGNDVTEVVIYVAKYKDFATKISVNGVTYDVLTSSNNAEYTPIVVDTTINKTVNFKTLSGAERCMINTIEFNGYF